MRRFTRETVDATLGLTSHVNCRALNGQLSRRAREYALSLLCRAQLSRAFANLAWSCHLCPSSDVQGIQYNAFAL
eukprot:5943823-Pleurochrysis_carterae.AAC.1